MKEDDWVFEVETYCNTIKNTVDSLKDEIGYLIQQTPIIRRFRYLKYLLKEYGSHKPDCKYLTILTPRSGEEYKLCTCGWYDIRMKLRRPR